MLINFCDIPILASIRTKIGRDVRDHEYLTSAMQGRHRCRVAGIAPPTIRGLYEPEARKIVSCNHILHVTTPLRWHGSAKKLLSTFNPTVDLSRCGG